MAKEETKAKLFRSKKKPQIFDMAKETKQEKHRELNEGRHHRITAYQKDLIDWITKDGNGAYLYKWLNETLMGNVQKEPDDLKKIREFKSLLHQAKEKPKRGRPRINPEDLGRFD